VTERVKNAVSCFSEGFSCSQAVLTAYSDLFNLDRKTALKISQPFGGGIAHQGETCGAVSAAFMVIGLKYGRTKAEDLEAREKTYEKTFSSTFTAIFWRNRLLDLHCCCNYLHDRTGYFRDVHRQ
jgi:C_GCAxxG_C_C family probable redox protein